MIYHCYTSWCLRPQGFRHVTDILDMQHNQLRTKDDTLKTLQVIFRHTSTVGGMTHTKNLKTFMGVKDTFQDFFLERIYTFSRKLRGSVAKKQELLDVFVATQLPKDILSPVWRITGERPITVTLLNYADCANFWHLV